jgi:uncharacterized protein
MNPVFLDTGYVLALELANDQYHQQVTEHWQTMAGALSSIVTTSYVFDEIVTFFNSRRCHEKAVEFGNNLLQSTVVNFIHVDELLFHESWQYLVRHRDKLYSLTDCVSFVVMNRLGITTALSLDHHFEQAGFRNEPVK